MKVFSVLAAVAIVVMGVGCSKAPELEMQNAEAALKAALSAEAPEYAAQAYQMAADTLSAAKAAKAEQDAKFGLLRSYGKSAQLFASAQRLAERAAAEAKAEKERVRGELSAMLAQTQALLDSANVVLANAPRGKGSTVDLDLIRLDLTAAGEALDQAKADFEAGRFRAARAGFEAVQGKAVGVIEEIQKASTRRPA